MALALWLLLAVQQDSRVEQLIAELASDSLEAREIASARLVEIGPSCLEALKRAATQATGERRARIASVLLLIQEVADAAPQRASKLGIVTVDANDVPLSELVRVLERQMSVRVKLEKSVDPARRVSLQIREKPINEALEPLRLWCGVESFGGTIRQASRYPGVHTDGVSFRFLRAKWPPRADAEGPPGVTIVPLILKSFDGDVEFDIVSLRTDREIPFKKCAIHGSATVFVPDPDVREVRVNLQGMRRWFRTVDVKFEDPRVGDSRRVGRFEVSLRWPDIVLRSDREHSWWVFRNVLREHGIRYKPKPGVTRGSSAPLPGCGGTWIPMNGPTPWCEHCRSVSPWQAPPDAKEYALNTYTINPLSDFESIEFTLRIPVEERFHLVSSPVKVPGSR